MRALVVSLAALSFSVSALADSAPGFSPQAWLEGGLVWQSRNDVRIPADGGTRFSIAELDHGPAPAFRVYLGGVWDGRHEVRLMAAPLTLKAEGRPQGPIDFQGKRFAAESAVTAKYRFDSYRATYRYTLVDSDSWVVRLGGTLKVRDAEISLSQNATTAARKNTGVVPLVSALVAYDLSPLRLLMDVDALASPQGRAEDVALLLGYGFTEGAEALVGYRTVEGGASGGGNVYNFAWLHYLVLGASLTWP